MRCTSSKGFGGNLQREPTILNAAPLSILRAYVLYQLIPARVQTSVTLEAPAR
jgi:hypothetical protein